MIRDFQPWLPLSVSLVVVLAPLPFGSVGMFESRLLFGVVAVLGLVTFLKTPDRGVLRASLIGPLALAGVALLGWIQSVAPPVDPQLGANGIEGMSRSFGPRSFAPDVSRAVATGWLAPALMLLVAAQAARLARGRRVLLGGFVTAGLFQGVYGGRRWAGDSETIWGRQVAGDSGRFRGTFVNPDHLAFFLGLVLPVVLAWAWWAGRRALVRRGPAAAAAAAAPALLIWVSLFIALALSGSRAGLLIAVGVAGAQGLIIARAERKWRVAALGLGFSSAGLAAISWLSLEGQALGRLAATSRYELQLNQRLAAYEAAIDLWQRFPLFGVGLGSFRQAFPLVKPEGLRGAWWHAHSDLLEVAVTLGAVGVLLVALASALVLRQVWRGTHARRSEDRAAAVAALGCCLAAGLHSAVDFSLTMPANSMALAVAVGCGCAASVGASTRSPAAAQSAHGPEGSAVETRRSPVAVDPEAHSSVASEGLK